VSQIAMRYHLFSAMVVLDAFRKTRGATRSTSSSAREVVNSGATATVIFREFLIRSHKDFTPTLESA